MDPHTRVDEIAVGIQNHLDMESPSNAYQKAGRPPAADLAQCLRRWRNSTVLPRQ